MKATYQKADFNFLPVVKFESGKVEVLYGPPLASRKTAIKYAQLFIQNMRARP
jgi:hypothetical protein